MEISQKDRILLDEAAAKIESKNKRFFEFHKISEKDVEEVDLEFEKFLSEDSKRVGDKSFFCSPLGRKSFVVGYMAAIRKMRR